MNRNTFNQLIQQGSWHELFITEMGWNAPQGQHFLPTITVDDTDYDFTVVAQRNGFQILTCEVAAIPNMSVCRKIDLKLRRQANDYIAIYTTPQSEHHLWACPLKLNEKRDMVIVEYATAEQADFLFSKMAAITFDIGEQTTIIDVRQHVAKAFAVNSEKITQNFYNGFRKQHKEFATFITGIDDNIPLYDSKKKEQNRNKLWYASVMLNRLMFCYFIQKKGFLNGDVDYLTNKLKQVQAEEGNNQFYRSFYRDFLVSLFHEGLNAPHHTPEWEHRFGRIPYLNGGMFDVHIIEQQYDDIDIADEAFTSLFAFFDTWQWHLDTRITATGKDINPDVLGYIFEQYINDRAAMGAYYTKEDITEYISKNCILPWVFDRVAESSSRDSFKPNGYVWSTLRESGDRYIYDAVKRGYSADWQQRIPADIAVGIDTSKPDLLERRKQWNRPTADQFALPTEIWRETIERLQRCDTLIEKISSGAITHINDFITLNLDIRSFTYDLLSQTTDHRLVANFYHALQNVTILDPTCGSGAFLFAAMSILEPLYEVCILRMQEWNAENPNLFQKELGEIACKYRSNIQYFIYKSIILRNLYGVDIMVEATEIAKLRLFLKMVAVVEVDKRADNMGLDPLPDIDFNIRCGNTLVGYATEQQLTNDLIEGDMFAKQEFEEKIQEHLVVVSAAYELFRQVQLTGADDRAEYAKAKKDLRKHLADLNELLNRHMFAADGASDYDAYLTSHQPFHWLAEFYNIIHGKGGFDVVIGNPPYVEYNKRNKETGKSIKDLYAIKDYKTINCANLYAFVIERSCILSNNRDNIGFIVPLTIASNNNMADLRNFICDQGTSWFSHYEIRPAKLFEGVEQRLTIFFMRNTESKVLYSTSIIRWHNEHRSILFHMLKYAESFNNGSIWRISNMIEQRIYSKFMEQNPTSLLLRRHGDTIYYRTAGIRYWIIFLQKGFNTESLSNKVAHVENNDIALSLMAIFNSNLFWWYYALNFDMFNLKDYMIFNFRYTYSLNMGLSNLARLLENDLEKKKIEQPINSKTRGIVKTSYYQKKRSKPIIDEIDKVLAKHYGFTDEELDFIINYDIKYRMGDELNTNG